MTDPSCPTPSLYTHPFPIYPPLPSKFPEPQLPSALQSRPREYSGSQGPEQPLIAPPTVVWFWNSMDPKRHNSKIIFEAVPGMGLSLLSTVM
jgi:hypothetical protein